MRLPDEYVQQLIDDLEVASQDYARAKAEADGLRELRKVTKAQLMSVAEAEGNGSIARQEVYAYGHPTYRAILERLRTAIEDETLRQYQCKLAELKFEAWRTISANQRAVTR